MKQTSMHICTLDSPVRMNEHVSYTNSHIACPHARIISDSATISALNFGDSATKIRYASATPKKRRFRNQKKTLPQPKTDDSAIKKRRFRNQKRTIPQPKSVRFGNQNPRHFATKIRAATLCVASSPSAGGWGGGEQNRSYSCGSCVPSFGTRAATLNMASSPDVVGWVGVGWDGVGQ